MSTRDIWTHDATAGSDLVGYSVEASDGGIGKVDDASYDVGASYLIVDTGPWIFGKKVMLPAGVVERVDRGEEKVYVDRTKDEIENAPEFRAEDVRDEGYREELGGYYAERARGDDIA